MIFDLSEEPEEEEEVITSTTSIGVAYSSTFNVSPQAEFTISPSSILSQNEIHTTALPITPKSKTRPQKRKKRSPLELSQQVEAKAKAKQAKDTLKQAKAQEKMIDLQKHGYYKTQEVSLVLPDDVYNSTLGGAILSHLMFATDNDKSYGCLSSPSSVSGLCRWTYRNYLDGGNATIGDAGSVVIPFVVVVFTPRVFLELVEATPDGVEFPLLAQEMQQLRVQMVEEEKCPARSKLVLMLIDIDEECKQYKKVWYGCVLCVFVFLLARLLCVVCDVMSCHVKRCDVIDGPGFQVSLHLLLTHVPLLIDVVEGSKRGTQQTK
jgi:hypothetical protein